MKAINLFVGVIALIAAASLLIVPWEALRPLWGVEFAGFATLLAFGLISESQTNRVAVAKSTGQSSIVFIPLWASVVLFGPAPTVLFMVVTGIIGETLIRRKEPIKAIFNVCHWIIAVVAGGLVYQSLGGIPLAFQSTGGAVGADLGAQIVPFVAFGAVFMAINVTSVSAAIAISDGVSVRQIAPMVLAHSGMNLLYDLLLSPIAIALAYLYLAADVLGLAVFLLPLLAIRHAYQVNLRLQDANRDLLRALVKAIETRDPYTSGHSVRVAALAKLIGRELGLQRRQLDMIETAALLHDIGKIDAVYSEILRKPAELSEDERQIIESHVTKGIELLKSVSSFPDDVLASIRYHHERMDGKGYPEGIRGRQIPMGARIIKVCDAVDAMLSDRPYRDALSLTAVREQLVIHSGTQFDPEIVGAILRSEVLEEHKEEVDRTRDATLSTPPVELARVLRPTGS